MVMLTVCRSSPTPTLKIGIFSRVARSFSSAKPASPPRLLRPSVKTMMPCTMLDASRATAAATESGTFVPWAIDFATSIRFSSLATFACRVLPSASLMPSGVLRSREPSSLPMSNFSLKSAIQFVAHSGPPNVSACHVAALVSVALPSSVRPRSRYERKSYLAKAFHSVAFHGASPTASVWLSSSRRVPRR